MRQVEHLGGRERYVELLGVAVRADVEVVEVRVEVPVGEHADDAQRRAADPHGLADGVGRAEQLVRERALDTHTRAALASSAAVQPVPARNGASNIAKKSANAHRVSA